MIRRINYEFKRNSKSVETFESAILKMYYLELDLVKEDFVPLFSSTGKPSNQPPEVFRSLILMSHFKYAGIDQWVAYASSSPLLCVLVGVFSDQFPGASTHRGLWIADKPNKRKASKSKPRGKHGKDKLPPKHPGVVALLVSKALSGKGFTAIPEKLLQTIFMKAAVIPSVEASFLGDTGKLDVSADGACVNAHASPFGHKVCSCQSHCSCKRKFSDPDAKWGWDSYHEQWFYGYTAYLLPVHNSDLKLDLPLYMRFAEASRN